LERRMRSQLRHSPLSAHVVDANIFSGNPSWRWTSMKNEFTRSRLIHSDRGQVKSLPSWSWASPIDVKQTGQCMNSSYPRLTGVTINGSNLRLTKDTRWIVPPSSPTATRGCHGCTVRHSTARGRNSAARLSPVAASQSISVPSSLPESTVLPSGLKVQVVTRPRWPLSVARLSPVAASQTISVPSSLPESTVLPSGLKAHVHTPFV